MYFFPKIYDNELLYSAIARYHEQSGNLSFIHTIEDVFGIRSAIAVVALPSRIKNIVENLMDYDEQVAKEITEKHTLLNFYAAFKSEELYSLVEQEMIETSGIGIYMKLGMVSSSTQLEKKLKYCPVCVKNEMEIYGEAYWHREHQVVGSIVCHLHHAILKTEELPVFGRNRQIFYRITPEICKKEPLYVKDSRKSDILVKIAVEINTLCNNRVNCSLNDFKNRIKAILFERGYIKPNNYTFMTKLTNDIREYYSDEVLELIGCSIEKQNWIKTICNPHKNVGQSIYIILLLIFLGYSVIDFNDMESLENININEYIQEQWDKKLIILVNSDLSQREICRELGTYRKTLIRAMKRLNLKKDWKSNGGSRYGGKDYIETEDYRVIEKKMKSTWLELHEKYPKLSSNQIRQHHDSVYAWLRRYQSEWMRENYRVIEKTNIKIDWVERDTNLLVNIENTILNFRSKIGIRISWSTIGGELGISGWLYRKKNMLPRCTSLIERNIESLEEYHLRVLRMAALELIADGVAIRKYTVLERAGVKSRYLPRLNGMLTEEDLLMGLDCLL